ncbi:MAG: zinc-ribbon domain-containing protein [Deltaproteobacteria bacterium]|nr:zinc-ribbon domain-containing protein [Deltaproteobacteria bacterium]
MRVRCDKCQAEYNVDDSRIPPQGVTIKCPKCQHSFVVHPAAVPLPGASGARPAERAVPLPGNAPASARQAPAAAATRTTTAPGAVPLPGAAPRPAAPKPPPATEDGLGGLFEDLGIPSPAAAAPAAPALRSAKVEQMFNDVQQPRPAVGDSIPSHPFHGDSTVEQRPAGGLVDFIDQQGPAAPGSGQLNYSIRRRSGRVFGPYDEETILAMLRKQELAGNEDASTDGEHWLPLSQISTFAEEIQALTAAAVGALGVSVTRRPPAATGGEGDLPGLKGLDLPGLKGADLPVPKGTARTSQEVADLPGIKGVDLPGLSGVDLPTPYSPDAHGVRPAETGTVDAGALDAAALMADIGISFSDTAPAAAEETADPLAAAAAAAGLADPMAIDLTKSTESLAREAATRKRSKPAGARKRKSSALASLLFLLALLAALAVTGGVFLGLATDHGWFGYKWLLAKFTEEPKPQPQTQPVVVVPTASGVPLEELIARDSFLAYQQAAQNLAPRVATSPEDAAKLAYLHARLALMDQDPTSVAAGRAALLTAKNQAQSTYGLFAAVAFDVAEGNCAAGWLAIKPKVGDKPPEKPAAELSETLALAGVALGCGDKAQPEQAAVFIDTALVANSRDTFALWAQSTLASAVGDYPTAAGYAEKILEIKPDNARAALLYALAKAHLPKPKIDVPAAFARAQELGKTSLAPWQLAQIQLGLAIHYRLHNKFDEAEAAGQKALEAAGIHAATLRQIGDLALEMFAPALAIKAFGKLVAATPDDAHAMIGNARGLAGTNEMLAAYDLLERAFKRDPKSALLAYWLGWLLLEMTKDPEARKHFETALALDPTQPAPVIALTHMFLRVGDVDGAQQFLNHNRQKVGAKHQAQLDLTQAEIHLATRKLREALASLQKANERGLDDSRARALRGIVLLDMGKEDEARELIELAYAANPRDPWLLDKKGDFLLQLGEAKEALALYQQASKREPKKALYHIKVAAAQLKLDDYQAAGDELKTASELAPKNPEVYFYQGLVARPKDTKQAEQLLKQAEQMAPKIARYSLELGRNYALQGNNLDAIDYYRSALLKDENMPHAHIELGRAYMELVRYGDARVEFEKALALAPHMMEVHIAIGETLGKGGDLKGALREYQAALAGNPKLTEAWCKAGELLKNEGKLKEAEAALVKCIAGKPKHPEAHKWLGFIYKEMRKKPKAREQFEIHLQINPKDIEADIVEDELKNLGAR